MSELEKNESKVSIEFEQVTVKIPKTIMEFLRKTECSNKGPEAVIALIEWHIVSGVRAGIDSVEPDEVKKWFKLDPAFSEVLGKS
jgi:hypothetical protein